MQENTPKIPFPYIVKHPVTYALIVVVSLFWGVFYWVTSRADISDNRCWEQVEELRKENRYLYQSLLVSNGIIKEIMKSDSTTSKEGLK